MLSNVLPILQFVFAYYHTVRFLLCEMLTPLFLFCFPAILSPKYILYNFVYTHTSTPIVHACAGRKVHFFFFYKTYHSDIGFLLFLKAKYLPSKSNTQSV